jgi:acyl dehydratase
VKVGSRVRARARLAAFQEKAPKQFLITQDITIEIENDTRPALVSQWLTMVMTG